MDFKKNLTKSFLSTTATAIMLALFTTGCPENMPLIQKKSGKPTPPELQEKVKKAGFDVNDNPIALAIDGKNITGLEIPKQSQALIKVEIPDGVEKISDNKDLYIIGEKGSFGSCHNLKTVKLPDSVIVIDEGSFHHCERLSEINITDKVKVIGPRAFIGCKELDLKIPASVEMVGAGAFVNVKSVQVAEGNKTLKVREDGSVVNTMIQALAYVKPGTIKYHVKGVKRLGAFTFEDAKIEDIVIDDEVFEIGNQAFKNSNLKSIRLPKNLTSIEPRTFESCKNLTSIEIPKNVKIIGEFAFNDCHNLTSFKLPENLEIIERRAFNTPGLSLEIPASVKEFYPGSLRVKEIKMKPNNKFYKTGKNGEIIHVETKALIYLPKNVKGKYVVPEEVTVIKADAFYNCNNITEIYVHDGVTKIESQEFYSKNLKTINVSSKTTLPKNNSYFLGRNNSRLVVRDAKK